MIEIDFHIIEIEKDGIDTSISDVKVAKTCTREMIIWWLLNFAQILFKKNTPTHENYYRAR